MSESHATTSVFLSCAVARLPAASAAAPTPAVTRKSRRLTRAPMCVPPSVRDLFGPEKDVLRALQVRAVELPHQLLPRGRRDVLLVLLRVADLDPLDVVPARGLGPVDRALDTVGAIAHDAGQRPRHLVVVVHEPALVVLGLHARLERGDHIAYRHGPASRVARPAPPARGSKQSSTSPGSSTWPSSAMASPTVAPSRSSRVARAAPSGRKRRSVPCITTVTVTGPPPALGASP